jgi:four helix bundle protein
MTLYGNQCLKQFPKSERYAMAAEIKQSMYRLLRLIIEANKKYHKKTTAQQIDIELETLRTFIRLASDKQLKYLSIKKYENWSKMLNEIGRMLGGWIKSMNK